MITAWTSHLATDEEKKRFENEIRGSRHVLDRIRDLIKADLSGLEASENSAKVYDLPNWDYRQAHKNGSRATYETILKLLNLDPKETNDPKSIRK
jgi:hypothetical protein